MKAYIAECTKPSCDWFILGVFADMESAIEAAESDKGRCHPTDAKGATWSVSSYNVPHEDGQPITEAFRDWSNEQCWLPDPEDYIVI